LSRTVLIIEDNPGIAELVRMHISDLGMQAVLADRGDTGLDRFREGGVDLVILDLMLPGMSGYAVCEAVRQRGIHLPVLMLSARTLAEDRTRGFDVGANQYLAKPFELPELISRIKNLLQSTPPRPEPPPAVETVAVQSTAFGNVEVNFATHEVFVAGDPQRMTPKELRLLKYFVEHPNRVIGRQELLSEVWEMPGDLQTRAVDQFVARLRKIIETNPAEPRHLLTIRDAGYRFLPEGPAS